ncbi:MAG: DUF2306 domain-containing protein [Ferruginibacter sp.]
MTTDLKNISKNILIYFSLCAAVFAMLLAISQYFSFKTDVGFLRFKQDYLDIQIWRIAFYTHVFSSIFTLCAGFTQFSDHVLKHHKKLHRFVGKMYAYNVMLINFPTGMIMAFYANGHLPSKIAFIILDCLWFLFTYKAVVAIKAKDIKAHKRFMIRSYALTCSAITLRSWKIILSHSFNIDPQTLYMIDAWMGFVPNLFFAEWLIIKMNLQPKKLSAQKLNFHDKNSSPQPTRLQTSAEK